MKYLPAEVIFILTAFTSTFNYNWMWKKKCRRGLKSECECRERAENIVPLVAMARIGEGALWRKKKFYPRIIFFLCSWLKCIFLFFFIIIITKRRSWKCLWVSLIGVGIPQYKNSLHTYVPPPPPRSTELEKIPWSSTPPGGGGGVLPLLKVVGTCGWTGYDFPVINIGTGYLNRPNWLLVGYSVYHRVASQATIFMTGPRSRHVQRRCVRGGTTEFGGRDALFFFLDQFRANYHSCYAIGYFVVFQLPCGRDVIVTHLRLRLFSKSSQLNKKKNKKNHYHKDYQTSAYIHSYIHVCMLRRNKAVTVFIIIIPNVFLLLFVDS